MTVERGMFGIERMTGKPTGSKGVALQDAIKLLWKWANYHGIYLL
jgi:hypothetical protein